MYQYPSILFDGAPVRTMLDEIVFVTASGFTAEMENDKVISLWK